MFQEAPVASGPNYLLRHPQPIFVQDTEQRGVSNKLTKSEF